VALQKAKFIPGINREGTRYSADSGWYDCDKMRFRKGYPETIGGWVKYTQESYKGVARALHDWSAKSGANYLAIGTNLKEYVEIGEDIVDITPIRLTTAAGDPRFAAVNGSSVLTVTETDHGAVLNDFVTFSASASLGGTITDVVLDQEYQITEIVDPDNFKIDVTTVANGSDTGDGGAGTIAAYQINVGTNAFVSGTGWGVGAYGDGPWGFSVALSDTNQLRLVSQDIFGDDLIFNPRGGGVYYWDESAGTAVRGIDFSDLAGASDTPIASLQTMVSDVDRHVICFGVNALGENEIDPLLIRWSDQENAAVWTPTATNSAGGQVLSVGTAVVGAVKARHEILVFTDIGITSMRFSGAPFVYTFSVVAENISLIAPKAAVAAGDSVYFMDREGFYLYKGSVQPIPCSVYDYVFSHLQKEQQYKIFAAANPDDSEVTWFYPVGGSNAEITNYVTYNYAENLWTIGTFDRGAWIHAGTKDYPVSASNDLVDVNTNFLFTQEIGHDADGSEMDPFIESGGMEIGEGDDIMFLSRIVADLYLSGMVDNVDIDVIIKGRMYPLESLSTLYTTSIVAGTTQNNVRVRSREIAIRLEGSGMGYGWRMGDFRFDAKKDGER